MACSDLENTGDKESVDDVGIDESDALRFRPAILLFSLDGVESACSDAARSATFLSLLRCRFLAEDDILVSVVSLEDVGDDSTDRDFAFVSRFD